MILETERLHLRPIVETDIPNMQKYFSSWEIRRYLVNTIPNPYPNDGSKTFYHEVIKPNQKKNRWFWAINKKEQPDYMIGQIELRRNIEDSPAREHRGFWLGLPYHGNGYMTEAVTAVTDFAFASLGFEEIIATSAANNIASRRVKEKQGMRYLETRTDSCKTAEGVAETDIFIMTRDDWMKLKR